MTYETLFLTFHVSMLDGMPIRGSTGKSIC